MRHQIDHRNDTFTRLSIDRSTEKIFEKKIYLKNIENYGIILFFFAKKIFEKKKLIKNGEIRWDSNS